MPFYTLLSKILSSGHTEIGGVTSPIFFYSLLSFSWNGRQEIMMREKDTRERYRRKIRDKYIRKGYEIIIRDKGIG